MHRHQERPGTDTEVARLAHEFTLRCLRGEEPDGTLRHFDDAARRWALAGVPFGTVDSALWEGARTAIDRVVAAAGGTDLPAAHLHTTLQAVHRMSSATYHAFRRELRARTEVTAEAEQALAVALLRGDGEQAASRLAGLPVGDAYHVVAARFSAPPPRFAAGAWSRFSAELRRRGTTAILSMVGDAGATLLIPESAVADEELDGLVESACAAADVEVLATVVPADRAHITAAHTQAHELLDLAGAAGRAPGLHRFRDLVVEYQVTRPSLARDRLATVLDPLAPQPELIDTLARHVRNELNRTRTARELDIHANTVDHRLRRIHQLTGYDPNQLADLCTLRAALLIRAVAPGQ
ncbi:PucR family transcriptional regulator [Nocardia blacklockiae]|uniref:PucR family transcriptional regulator n=1 Tax=Nocardia blacklockiae TaxID=480036 RepID=UPI001894095F|nr:PucR family transcriptional regulator [Nocardia blacklockiae]MBF6169913.1 helix-turn-helix domain-containing protein [Nocardia blacklockiae]